MEFDLGKELGATEEPSAQRLTLYIPNKDCVGQLLEDHEKWTIEAQQLLTDIGNGATAFPPVDGTWRKPDGTDLWEQTKLIYTYVDPDKLATNMRRLRDFLHRFGRETNQGEVVLEFDGWFWSIDKYDSPTEGRIVMAKKIHIVGARPKKIEVVDQPKRRIEPEELAAALGANPTGQQAPGALNPIALAELGTQLLKRLRSSGGRPALEDATINCRVPLSAEDVHILETILSHLSASTGVKPSVGQLASAIVRLHLNALRNAAHPTASPDIVEHNRQQLISRSILQQMIDEQISPLREQVKHLETELRDVRAGKG